MWLTVLATAVGAFLIGPGLGVLTGIVGTVLVVIAAYREEQRRAAEALRAERRRESALKAGGWGS